MALSWCVIALLCAAAAVEISCTTGGEVIRVSPEGNQSVPIDSQDNVTYTCNVTGGDVVRRAIWEVEGRQIQTGTNPLRTTFENIGVIIEELLVGLVVLTVNSTARITYMDTGVRLRCVLFVEGEPPEFGPLQFVNVYGRPDVPGDLRLEASKPTSLVWSRPANIPADVPINYTVTINSSTSAIREMVSLVNVLQFSIEFLEEALADAEQCEGFMFFVTASVADADDSMAAVTIDTVPLSTNVSFIDSTLQVDTVRLSGDGVTATVSFQAVESCSDNFPIRNYTLLVEGVVGPTVAATPTDSVVTTTVSTEDLAILVPDQMFQVGVQVCSDVTCRDSLVTVVLNTSDVQTAQVIFYENNVFLRCVFADGSSASGCMFTFQVNQNGTGNDQFSVLRSNDGQQCNMTNNQRTGYVEISVVDVEFEGMFGQLSLSPDVLELESEQEYVQMTGCAVPTGPNRVVNIVVPIVVVLLLLLVLTITVVALVVYFRSQKKGAEFAESDLPDTLSVTIKSDHEKLLQRSPMNRRFNTVPVMRSLPVTSHPITVNPQRSLPRIQTDHTPLSFSVPPEKAHPIEVELHRNSVKLKLNKTALRAVARFHYNMARRQAQASEGVAAAAPESLSLEESQSLLGASISRVHITDEFKSMCYDLPPVEEGGEEEEELKSWGIISTPPLSPPHKEELSHV